MAVNAAYIGRFAPSPTGQLHFGSLCCALASYLDAKQYHGQWLIRIEDIDPPREQPGAALAMVQALALHGLVADQPVLYQSQRHGAYQTALETLAQQQLIYPCACTRARLALLNGRYDNFCRHQQPSPPYALRLKTQHLPSAFAQMPTCISFIDRHFGEHCEDLAAGGDFIIHRKDGLFAYQLAVVIDDIHQKITHVVRGYDLLETTAKQIFLFQLLGKKAPEYGHIPLLVNPDGQKLSKQNAAPPLNLATPSLNLWRALQALGACPPALLQTAAPAQLLAWGVAHWRFHLMPASPSIAAPQ